MICWVASPFAVANPCSELHLYDNAWLKHQWLRPTQSAVGMAEVDRQVDELYQMTSKDEVKEDFLKGDPLEVVIGPDGLCYVTDGHHHWEAAWKSLKDYREDSDDGWKIKKMRVHVSGDYQLKKGNFDSLSSLEKKKAMRDFWVRMIDNGKAWPFDEDDHLVKWFDADGHEVSVFSKEEEEAFKNVRPPIDRKNAKEVKAWDDAVAKLAKRLEEKSLLTPLLPKTAAGLKNDPYRALAKFLAETGGFKKAATKSGQLFQEFYWARQLRKIVNLPKGRIAAERWRSAIRETMRFARSVAAKDLPGNLYGKIKMTSNALGCRITEVLQKFLIE